ncbi:PH domain-containing protein [Flaviflexus sp.]|uniref:PH domain-containing protein n=1 Tax=Flaviflexus sp. TaxID=1969482 RepID=UPI003F927846
MIMSPLAPGISLVGISRDQAKIRGLIAVICLLPLLALLIVSIALWDLLWVTIAVAVALVIGLFIMFVQVRAVFYTGYHETDEELLVCRGILFQKLDVVPYGRMQEVTVEDGPLMRHYGLAKITMETASSTTDTSIPGVRRDEADRLRRRLTELGSTKMEGL